MSRARWERLPAELRERAQWLLAGPNDKGELKVPTSVDALGRLVPGSSTNAATWMDFDYAVECAEERGYGIGFVLSSEDPFTCVDFDIKNATNEPDPAKHTPPEWIPQLVALAQDLDSYTELSPSQQGVHVWVRGKFAGDGVKRHFVEVYCRGRFMTCTGMHIHSPPKPVAERAEQVEQLVSSMRAAQAAKAGSGGRALGLVEGEEEITDDELMRRAWNADNGEKFRALWAGDWVSMGYPSQSEADLALMSMLTFYSHSNEQCRRVFRLSGLGAREKAVKDDRYLNFTLRLIRGRQQREAEAMAVVEAKVQEFAENKAAALAYARQLQGLPPVDPAGAHSTGAGLGAVPAAQAGDDGLPWPPGFAGALARFMYSSNVRAVKEVAIVSALGFLAGVCGKAWHIPGSGLNVYMVLIGRSGVGKEGLHTSLGLLMNRVQQAVPGAHAFVNFGQFASAPALTKALAEWSSMVNATSEFGRTLAEIAKEKSDTLRTLRTLITALYQKSGPSSVVGGISYSNKDKNVGSVSGVAYSLIGETTPDTLYESLTQSMMADGFLSRFTFVEYTGDRPPANANLVTEVPNDIAQATQALCVQALTMLHNGQRCLVQRTQQAADAMNAFDLECDAAINATEDEAKRQTWNRAHLKMLRVAALLAVADNHMTPVIDLPHVLWALELVRRDIAVMQRRIATGDVGTTDDSRERKLVSLICDFLDKPLPPGYGIPTTMQRDNVIPRKYLQIRTKRLTAFDGHPRGAVFALDQTLKSMCDSGYLSEMDKAKAGEQYTFQGRCFRVLQLPPH